MAGARVSFTETLDLTAVSNYDNEIKKSIYSEDVEKNFALTSKILQNVTYLFNRDDVVSHLSFDDLNEKTKAKLARIFLDHAISAKILSSRRTSFIIVTPSELIAYFDTAIHLCTTEADKQEFQRVKQNPLFYYNKRIKGQELKSDRGAKSILTPAQLRDKLDYSIVPKNLVIESFEGNDTHLAAAARTSCDEEGTMNSVVTVLFNQIAHWNWNTDQLYTYLTRPIPSQDHHCIISLSVMNANKFLPIFIEKIESYKGIGFKAGDLIKKLASYRVPNGKDKGESLFTLAIKYGDLTRHHYKLIEIYNRYFPRIRTEGKKETQPNPLFVSATDCMGRTELDIAREAYFDTAAEFGYHSRQANMTFNMIYNFSKGKKEELLWDELKAECDERGIPLDKAGPKLADSKKRKRTEDRDEHAESTETDRVAATSTDIDGFTIIASESLEILRALTNNRPSKKANIISDSTAETSAPNPEKVIPPSSATSSPMDVDVNVNAATSSLASTSVSAAKSTTKTTEDAKADVTPVPSTSTTAKMIVSLVATPPSTSVPNKIADTDIDMMEDAKQSRSTKTRATTSPYNSLNFRAQSNRPTSQPLPKMALLSPSYNKRRS